MRKNRSIGPHIYNKNSDYVADYWEIYNYYTDPTKSDSDGDGAPDWFEISYMGYNTDTDNDGFDEIITTDPEGRIVIIDNGTPPSENQNDGFYSQELLVGITAAVISSVAIIWTWRKRK